MQQVGLIPTLTQAGYALGLLLFVPLGDRVDVRWLIMITLMTATLALLAAAVSPNLEWLLLVRFAIGMVSVTAQLILPFAAKLVSSDRQGRVLGTILSAVSTSEWLARRTVGLAINLLAGGNGNGDVSDRLSPMDSSSEPSVTTPYP